MSSAEFEEMTSGSKVRQVNQGHEPEKDFLQFVVRSNNYRLLFIPSVVVQNYITE